MPDSDVGKYLKMLTLLDIEEIDNIMELHKKTPEKYIAQEKLASEITELVHGGKILIVQQTRGCCFLHYPILLTMMAHHSYTHFIISGEALKRAKLATSLLFDSSDLN